MSSLEKILNAKTATEFFIDMFHLMRGRPYLTKNTIINSVSYDSKQALQFPVEQNIPSYEDYGTVWSTEITHTFTLTDEGEIIWEMKGREPVIGLDHVKALLQQGIDEAQQSNSYNNPIAGTHNIAGFLPISSE